jgi:hypothetical protein
MFQPLLIFIDRDLCTTILKYLIIATYFSSSRYHTCEALADFDQQSRSYNTTKDSTFCQILTPDALTMSLLRTLTYLGVTIGVGAIGSGMKECMSLEHIGWSETLYWMPSNAIVDSINLQYDTESGRRIISHSKYTLHSKVVVTCIRIVMIIQVVLLCDEVLCLLRAL